MPPFIFIMLKNQILENSMNFVLYNNISALYDIEV